MLIAGVAQHRVDDISKEFTGDGWKSPPQELVDAILSYLLDDVETLKACSHTSACLAQRSATPLGFPLYFCRTGLERLVDAERWDLLRYIQHLTLEVGLGTLSSKAVQEYLPHFRSFTNLHTLTLDTFHPTPFLPLSVNVLAQKPCDTSTYGRFIARISYSCTSYPSFLCWKT